MICKITEEAKSAFDSVKKLMTSQRGLMLPDVAEPFLVISDVSDLAADGVSNHLDETGEKRVVAYCSGLFTEMEQKASSCERELSANLKRSWCVH